MSLFQRLAANIGRVVVGQDETIRNILVALVSGGHVLLEDRPGTGKTTLAKALARSLDLRFTRIQFTPDLLPSDIVGVSVFDPRDQAFHFHDGPVFTQILLADEINRASPRTQSALLEAMGEAQVSLDGVVRPLSDPFFVIATQNPIEFRGTYPLPEAQMDRFAMQLSLGYVAPDQECDMLRSQQNGHPLDEVSACATADDLVAAKREAESIRVSDELRRYIVALVAATRSAPGVRLGASPRASIALMKGAQALAFAEGREFVVPDDVQALAVPVVAHRVALDSQARFSGMTAPSVVMDALKTIPVPT